MVFRKYAAVLSISVVAFLAMPLSASAGVIDDLRGSAASTTQMSKDPNYQSVTDQFKPQMSTAPAADSSSAKPVGSNAWKDGTMASENWTFDSTALSPSSNPGAYKGGPKENFTNVLKRVANMLLVAISVLAVLLIAVAGFRMAISAGNSDEAAKGKTMVRFNILALVTALMAYTIIQAVTWILSAT
jgi:hypothetical protein